MTSGAAFWLGLWIFACVFFVGDTWWYSQGHETFFWEHKTPKEKELQADAGYQPTQVKPQAPPAPPPKTR